MASDTDDTNITEVIGDDSTTTESSVTTTNFVTRIFHEEDNQVIGAEVIVYDDESNKIDSIIITDTTSLEEFQEKWESISDYYIINGDADLPEDLQEKLDEGTIQSLQDILANTDDATSINATTLNGVYTSDNFSLSDHNHDDEYAIVNHISSTGAYGVGTSSVFGHTKIVDNLNDSTYNEGTALSSHQGYVLDEKISSVSSKFQWSSVIQPNNYMKYRVNPDLRLVVCNYNRSEYTGCKKTTGSHVLHNAGTIPDYYAPTSRVTTPLYRGDFVLYYNTDGSVNLYNLNTTDDVNIHAQVMWHF